MGWCNAVCDSMLLIANGCMNIQEDTDRGELTIEGK